MADIRFLTDSHLHMCETGFPGNYGDFDSLTRAVSCTADPGEWDLQLSFSSRTVVPSIGVHPWNCGCWNVSVEERFLSILEKSSSCQIGDVGLDSKKGDVSEQMPSFTGQLDAASSMDRVVSIHMVGAEKQVLDAIRTHGRSCRGIILHSFSSESYVKPFLDLGCMFSLSPRILARSKDKVRRLLDLIPDDRLLLESDAPHQGRFFTGMGDFVRSMADVKGCSPHDLARNTYENLERTVG